MLLLAVEARLDVHEVSCAWFPAQRARCVRARRPAEKHHEPSVPAAIVTATAATAAAAWRWGPCRRKIDFP